jgi:hypothetical protein
MELLSLASECSFLYFLHSLNPSLFYIMDVTKTVRIMSITDSSTCGTSSSLAILSRHGHVDKCICNRFRGFGNPVVITTLTDDALNVQVMETRRELLLFGERPIICKFC